MFRSLGRGSIDCAVYMLSPIGILSSWSAGAERLKGYKANEIVGRHFSRFYCAEDLQDGLPGRALETALDTGRFEGESWCIRRDGSRFWASVVIDPICDEDGKLIGFAEVVRNLTGYRQQTDQLTAARKNLDLALSNMSQGLCLFGEDERLILCNRRFREIFSLSNEATQPGALFCDVLSLICTDIKSGRGRPEEEIKTLRERHLAMVSDRRSVRTVTAFLRGCAVSSSHRALPQGGWVSTFDDVTEQQRIADQLAVLARHDMLTGLLNRATFHGQLGEVLAGLRGSSTSALLYLDLDRFKPVNDTLGHPVGDAVLKLVADRIQAQLGKDDTVARLGGDEFAILLQGCSDPRKAAAVAERLIAEISRPMQVMGLHVIVGASIGVAMAPQHGQEPDLLIRNADLALYRAKEAGRARSRFYEAGMEMAVQQRRELERDLHAALAKDEFILHYQPIVDTQRGRLTGFEALIRWRCPSRGDVSPVDFVPFAEEIGMMETIGDWVLRTACLDAADWPSDLKLSVNLSPAQFHSPDLVERIVKILHETGLPLYRLEIEVTETAMIDDVAAAATILRQLRDLGLQIAMDDFGTGYSSLSFLHTLPFTRIKIDRSFVASLGVKPEAVAIVHAVAWLCSSLGVSATAEGVETEEQLKILQNEGCYEMQGYLFGRPRPAGEVMDWIKSYERDGGRSILKTASSTVIAHAL